MPRPGAAEVPLVRHDRQLACPNGHGFDIARQGYVNLAGGAPPANADTAPMIDARQRFLDSGVYEPIRQAVSHASDAAHWLVEVGAGTGWYLDGVLTHRRDAVGLATDVSVAAAKRAARSGLASVVADTWAGLPIRSASVDAVLCVFAPAVPQSSPGCSRRAGVPSSPGPRRATWQRCASASGC